MSVGNQGNWVMSSPSDLRMEAGLGGALKPGTYYLVRLVRHGERSACFDPSYAIAQTLELSDSGGQVVSDDLSRRRWASRFTYAVSGNTIQLMQSCTESSADPKRAPFGPFETYTAQDDMLWLFSSSCNYRAEYAYYGPPVVWR
jgi:hypothetical protein